MAVRIQGALGWFLVVSLAMIQTGCDRARDAEASQPELSAMPAPPVPAQVATTAPTATPMATAVAGAPVSRVLGLDSHLLVERDVAVMARRDGFIETIHVNRGDRVRENQNLATLEHRDLELSERISRLELEKEQASFERARKLHEQAIMTKEEFEQARLRRDEIGRASCRERV